MKHLLTFLLFALLVLSNVARADMSKAELQQYAEGELQKLAELWPQDRFEEALTILEGLRATPGMDQLGQLWINTLYNIACAHSRLGHHHEALVALAQVVDAGFSDTEQLQRDTDLDLIRQDPRFAELAVRVNARATFWDSPAIATPYREQLPVDEMLAGLAKLWAEVKYDFVRYDRLALAGWDSLYTAYLPRVREARNTLEYSRLLSRMCAHLKDGHTRVDGPNELAAELYYCPPIKTLRVEGRLLITAVLDDSLRQNGIVPGLEVVQIDGMPVEEYAEQKIAPYISASTPQALTWQTYSYYLLCGSRQRPVELTLQNTRGREIKRALPRSRASWARSPVTYRLLKKNIAYINLPTFGHTDILRQFDSLFAEISAAAALIIDLRENTGGNSWIGYNILGYFTDTTFATLRSTERAYRPARRPFGGPADSWETRLGTWPPNGKKLYPGPVVLLIGSATGSAAEDFTVAFDIMNRGTLIGEPTGGSTGQPLTFALPGGLAGIVCVDYCTYPDGREFVGVGIQPDIVVQPTVKSLRAGRDLVLETAISHLAREQR